MAHEQAVVITGVSTGIGLSAAQTLTKAGYRVFGSVRKAQDGERVQAALGPLFTPLIFDVTDEAAAHAAAAQVAQALDGQALAGLVNNAGIAVPGPLAYMPIADFRRQFDVNVIGLLITTQAFAPLLGAKAGFTGKPGRIVNISSVAGKVAMPFNGAYSGSKFAVEGLSDSLRREMQFFGVDVILIEPGPVKTEIWNKIGSDDVAKYAQTPFAQNLGKMLDYMNKISGKAVPAQALGDLIFTALTADQPKARYIITPSLVEHYITRYLPTRMVDRMVGKMLGLLPR
jgi:NAD(P)-dependent dehydrogenase (short-subunit alcohol dehydrogenase family)